tara:strand:- start:34548 stop:34796 length:249 start_codon:yes stop_codon:yes gene_type:complete
MLSLDELKTIIADILQIPGRLDGLGRDDTLLGGIPEFDSMAVVSVLTTVEDNYGITVDDDEISAEDFETFGALLDLLNAKAA